MTDIKKFQAIVLTECSFCKKAVNLLKKEKKQFSVLVLDHDEEMLANVKSNTNHPTVPIIIGMMENGQQVLIGGFTELEKFLTQQPQDTTEVKQDG